MLRTSSQYHSGYAMMKRAGFMNFNDANHCDSYFPKSTISLHTIFRDSWNDFSNDPEIICNGIRPCVKSNVEKMIKCGVHLLGHSYYERPQCENFTMIFNTCKSRFCPSCGVQYAKQRALIMMNHCFDVNHRHVVLTIDERLRFYFKRDRNLLNLLFESAYETCAAVIRKAGRKSEELTPGVIAVLHTYGRDLKWNPHIHCLVTEGGVSSAKIFKPLSYIIYESLRKTFRKLLLYKMIDALGDEFKNAKNEMSMIILMVSMFTLLIQNTLLFKTVSIMLFAIPVVPLWQVAASTLSIRLIKKLSISTKITKPMK